MGLNGYVKHREHVQLTLWFVLCAVLLYYNVHELLNTVNTHFVVSIFFCSFLITVLSF